MKLMLIFGLFLSFSVFSSISFANEVTCYTAKGIQIYHIRGDVGMATFSTETEVIDATHTVIAKISSTAACVFEKK